MSLIFQHISLRWAFPSINTAFLLLLMLHKSPDAIVLSRYNGNFFTLILSTALFTAVCWWVCLSKNRYLRLTHRISQLPIVAIVIVGLGLLALIDLFIDLIAMIAVFPLLLALGLLLLVMPLNFSRFGRVLRTPKFREALRILALVMVSIFSGLIMAEFLFRTLLLEPKVPTTEQQFYNLIASSWPHNIAVEKPTNTFRILGLSDSFGRVGDDKNYHYLLENLLHEDGYDHVELINISAVDYGPFDELEMLKRFGARYRPDLVLHGFYIGNDFGVPNTHVMVYQNIGVRMPQGTVAYRPRNLLVVQWLRSFGKVQIDKIRQAQEVNAAPSTPPGVMSNVGFLNIERRFLENYRTEPAPQQRWASTVKNLDAIRTEVHQLGADYVLVVHPDQIQLDPDLKQTLETTFELELNNGYNFELPQQFLADYCQAHSLLCLNLLPVFAASHGPQLYQANDIHYSQPGNHLAAQSIFEYLQQHALVNNKPK